MFMKQSLTTNTLDMQYVHISPATLDSSLTWRNHKAQYHVTLGEMQHISPIISHNRSDGDLKYRCRVMSPLNTNTPTIDRNT